jgi:O-antigen/teichoic acid export membrane protein
MNALVIPAQEESGGNAEGDRTQRGTQSAEHKAIDTRPSVLTPLMAIADQALVSGASFATSVIIGRTCSKEDLGVYSLALSLVLLVRGIQGELVCSPYTIFSSRRGGRDLAEYTGSALVHYLILSVASVVCMLGAAWLLSLGVGPTAAAPTIWVVAGAVPFLLLREYIRQVSLAQLRLTTVLAIDASVSICQVGGLMLLTSLGVLTVGLAYVVMGTACAAAVLGWFLTRKGALAFNRARFGADWRHNWSFGRWALMSYLICSTSAVLMPWVVALACGEATAGALAACTTLSNIAGMYITGVANFLTPRAARAFARGGRSELQHVLRRTALLFLVTLGGFVLLILITGDLPVRLVYGSKYSGTGPVLGLLALTMLLNSLGITAGNGLWVLDGPRANVAADVCTLVVTLGVVCALVGSLGILGAALALLAGAGAGVTVRCLTLWSRLKELPYQQGAA